MRSTLGGDDPSHDLSPEEKEGRVMHAKVKVATSSRLRKRYQSVLRSDWGQPTLDEILALLWNEIKDTPTPPQEPWWTCLSAEQGHRNERDSTAVERIKFFAESFRPPFLPEIHASFEKAGKGAPAGTAQATWTYLILQSIADVDDSTGLFADTQSVLFIAAIDYLLPVLQKLLPECACLLNALYMHTMLVWRDDPIHQYYLQSLIMDHLQQDELRFQLLLRSFQLTPVEDHSYLTKAQAAWSDLIDSGKQEAAEDFLLNLYRSSPTQHLSEVREMIHALYAASFKTPA